MSSRTTVLLGYEVLSYLFPELYERVEPAAGVYKNSPTFSGFKRQLMRLIRPPERSLFGIHDTEGVPLLTPLQVGFSDLRKHKFRHISVPQ